MGFFSNLFNRNKNKLALPEANPEIIDNAQNNNENVGNKFTDFKNEIKQQASIESKTNKENDSIMYDPSSFSIVVKWQDWYMQNELRNRYYNAKDMDKRTHIEYGGALTVLPMEDNQNKIICEYIDKETRQAYQLELGKIKGNSYNDAMYEIESIIALQVAKPFGVKLLPQEIQRHYEDLRKIKDLKLSKIGERMLSSTGDMVIALPNLKGDKLYEQAIDFSKMPVVEKVTPMPVTCMQLDANGKEKQEIEDKVEYFYKYCQLAVDIGAIEKEEWKKIDFIYDAGNNKNFKKSAYYDRTPQFHRESFDEIKETYLTLDQLQEVDQRTNENLEDSGIIGKQDKEELAIIDIVKKTMNELPLKLEDFILKYQLIHENDKSYLQKINLLNDIVNHSKIKFLEEKGLYNLPSRPLDREVVE